MRTTFKLIWAFVVILLLGAIPSPSLAQLSIGVGISINIGPPPLPYYQPAPVYYAPNPVVQPPPYAPNLIWEPGYWAWGPGGYYWVPGTWVPAPAPGLVWTPGYWGWSGFGFVWSQGFWGATVGYYGGVNYGCGYYGNGYVGGGWSGNTYQYNTAVTNVNTTIIKNVYVDKTVIVNNNNTFSRVSYNGGPGGLRVQPTAMQRLIAHVPPTAFQTQHAVWASKDRNLLASVNHGRPPVLTVARPLSATNLPRGFKPITPADQHVALKYVKKGPATAPIFHPYTPVVHHTAAPMLHHYTPVVHHTAAPMFHHYTPVVHHTPAPRFYHYTPVHHPGPAVPHTAAPKPRPT